MPGERRHGPGPTLLGEDWWNFDLPVGTSARERRASHYLVTPQVIARPSRGNTPASVHTMCGADASHQQDTMRSAAQAPARLREDRRGARQGRVAAAIERRKASTAVVAQHTG